MASLRVTLSDEMREFIDGKIKSGEYASARDVVHAGLAMLKHQRLSEGFAPGELDELIAAGERSIEAEGLVSLEASFQARHERRARRRGKRG